VKKNVKLTLTPALSRRERELDTDAFFYPGFTPRATNMQPLRGYVNIQKLMPEVAYARGWNYKKGIRIKQLYPNFVFIS
jgi:hypothetical protein